MGTEHAYAVTTPNRQRAHARKQVDGRISYITNSWKRGLRRLAGNALTMEDLADLKKELEDLRTKIKEAQQAAVDKTFAEALKDVDKEARFRLKQRKVLKGHISKVTSAHFCGDSKYARNFLEMCRLSCTTMIENEREREREGG
ncbi:guanine nucleotide-binding protein G(I)/G(S)/G(T) subunit beta-1 [Ixodes scapularis]